MSDDLLERLVVDGRILYETHTVRMNLEDFVHTKPGEAWKMPACQIRLSVEFGWVLGSTLPLQVNSGGVFVIEDTLEDAKEEMKSRLRELIPIAKAECARRTEEYNAMRLELEEAERLLYDGNCPKDTAKRKVKL